MKSFLVQLLIFSFYIAGVESSTDFKFTFTNKCLITVWPGIYNTDWNSRFINLDDNSPWLLPSDFPLKPGESKTFSFSSPWKGGFIWGRTYCSGLEGNFSCVTGDCGSGEPKCDKVVEMPNNPITTVKLSYDRASSMYMYALSVAFGYNLPILVAPIGRSGGDCVNAECSIDNLNIACPVNLQVRSSSENTIACKTKCLAYSTDEFCCKGSFSNSSMCRPTEYSQVFERLCPQASNYNFDVENATHHCDTNGFNITFCPSQIPKIPPTRVNTQPTNKETKIIIIVVAVCATIFLMLAISYHVVQKKKQGRRVEMISQLSTLDRPTQSDVSTSGGVKIFSYESIVSATSNFSPDCKLGQGGFGSVYKGIMPEGQLIAVKVLSLNSGQGMREFETEVTLISKLQHVNLVKLIGICVNGDEKMIIYDYMPNNSLHSFLFDPSGRDILNWQLRFGIIEGIAEGLLYLHKYSRLKIIHRDLKPSNILLDDNMNAKISDFGLARVFEPNAAETRTRLHVGTIGYMAPEYATQGIFSIKSDIFSFGVLLLEIVGGRRIYSFNAMEGPADLIQYAWDLWREDLTAELIDPCLRGSDDLIELKRCIHIALLCVEYDPVDRPTTENLVLMLKGKTSILPEPKHPSYYMRSIVFGEGSTSMQGQFSINYVTTTDVDGR